MALLRLPHDDEANHHRMILESTAALSSTATPPLFVAGNSASLWTIDIVARNMSYAELSFGTHSALGPRSDVVDPYP